MPDTETGKPPRKPAGGNRPVTATPGNQYVRALAAALPPKPHPTVSRSTCICVGLVLFALADSTGYIRRSAAYIARFASLHRQTVGTAIDVLVACGMLQRLRERYGRQPAAYMLPWAQMKEARHPWRAARRGAHGIGKVSLVNVAPLGEPPQWKPLDRPSD